METKDYIKDNKPKMEEIISLMKKLDFFVTYKSFRLMEREIIKNKNWKGQNV